jgi:hypothetical protein
MYRPEREPKLIGQAAKFCAIDVTRSHRTQPQHPDVWLCIEGEWREGRVNGWFRLGEQWFVSIGHQTEGGVQIGNWWYDEEAIIPFPGKSSCCPTSCCVRPAVC